MKESHTSSVSHHSNKNVINIDDIDQSFSEDTLNQRASDNAQRRKMLGTSEDSPYNVIKILNDPSG